MNESIKILYGIRVEIVNYCYRRFGCNDLIFLNLLALLGSKLSSDKFTLKNVVIIIKLLHFFIDFCFLLLQKVDKYLLDFFLFYLQNVLVF